MNDLTIVHLSDLHLKKTEGDVLPNLYIRLLEDIEKYKTSWKYVELVVTGDIIDHGKYEAVDLALAFFKQLKGILGRKCKGIHIVPGNHDIKDLSKDAEAASWLKKVDKDKTLKNDFYVENKDLFEKVDKGYIEMVNEIYALFGRAAIEYSYNVTIDPVGNKNICFIEGMSSLNSGRGGIKDKRRIRFGKYQLDFLSDEYNKKKSELKKQPSRNTDIDLTFLLLHHPINWLNIGDEDLLQSYALSPNTFDVDFVLCGHTHIQDIYHLNKNYKSMMTLATGIGWQEMQGAERSSMHRYAIYNISLDANSMEIYNRCTNAAGVFENDTGLFSQEQIDEMNNKIILPLKMQKNKGYFELSTVEGRSTRPYFYSKKILEDFSKYRTKLNQWFYDAGDYLHELREDLYREIVFAEQKDFLDKYENDEKVMEKDKFEQKYEEKRKKLHNDIDQLADYLLFGKTENQKVPSLLKEKEHKVKVYKQLDAYLQYLCARLTQLLFADSPSIKRGRVHFRYGYKANEEMHYSKLCAYAYENGIKTDYDVSDAEWSDLIKEAFVEGRTLIYSVNSTDCKKKLAASSWDNYLTSIPRFDGNKMRYRYDTGMGGNAEERKRPLLSFGITIKGKGDNMLYYLDYVNIEESVGDLIDAFIRYTNVNFQNFISDYVREKYE